MSLELYDDGLKELLGSGGRLGVLRLHLLVQHPLVSSVHVD